MPNNIENSFMRPPPPNPPMKIYCTSTKLTPVQPQQSSTNTIQTSSYNQPQTATINGKSRLMNDVNQSNSVLIGTVNGNSVGVGPGRLYSSISTGNVSQGATQLNTQGGAKANSSDPQVRKLVYNMYRGLLSTKHDRANNIVESAPQENVITDEGVGDRVESMMRQQKNFRDSKMNAGPPPPPPPPPFATGVTATKLPSEIPVRASPPVNFIGPPAALAGAMMKEKKPFTYTPGGINLAEIKSPRMQRRLQRNASLEGVRPSPLAQQQPPSPGTSQGGGATILHHGMIQVLPMPGIGMGPIVKPQPKEPPKPKRNVCGPAPPPPPFIVSSGSSVEPSPSQSPYATPAINSMTPPSTPNTFSTPSTPSTPAPALTSSIPFANGLQQNNSGNSLISNDQNGLQPGLVNELGPFVPVPPPLPPNKRSSLPAPTFPISKPGTETFPSPPSTIPSPLVVKEKVNYPNNVETLRNASFEKTDSSSLSNDESHASLGNQDDPSHIYDTSTFSESENDKVNHRRSVSDIKEVDVEKIGNKLLNKLNVEERDSNATNDKRETIERQHEVVNKIDNVNNKSVDVVPSLTKYVEEEQELPQVTKNTHSPSRSENIESQTEPLKVTVTSKPDQNSDKQSALSQEVTETSNMNQVTCKLPTPIQDITETSKINQDASKKLTPVVTPATSKMDQIICNQLLPTEKTKTEHNADKKLIPSQEVINETSEINKNAFRKSVSNEIAETSKLTLNVNEQPTKKQEIAETSKPRQDDRKQPIPSMKIAENSKTNANFCKQAIPAREVTEVSNRWSQNVGKQPAPSRDVPDTKAAPFKQFLDDNDSLTNSIPFSTSSSENTGDFIKEASIPKNARPMVRMASPPPSNLERDTRESSFKRMVRQASLPARQVSPARTVGSLYIPPIQPQSPGSSDGNKTSSPVCRNLNFSPTSCLANGPLPWMYAAKKEPSPPPEFIVHGQKTLERLHRQKSRTQDNSSTSPSVGAQSQSAFPTTTYSPPVAGTSGIASPQALKNTGSVNLCDWKSPASQSSFRNQQQIHPQPPFHSPQQQPPFQPPHLPQPLQAPQQQQTFHPSLFQPIKQPSCQLPKQQQQPFQLPQHQPQSYQLPQQQESYQLPQQQHSHQLLQQQQSHQLPQQQQQLYQLPQLQPFQTPQQQQKHIQIPQKQPIQQPQKQPIQQPQYQQPKSFIQPLVANNLQHNRPHERIIPIMIEDSPPVTPSTLGPQPGGANRLMTANNAPNPSGRQPPIQNQNSWNNSPRVLSPPSVPPSSIGSGGAFIPYGAPGGVQCSSNALEALQQMQQNLAQLNSGLQTAVPRIIHQKMHTTPPPRYPQFSAQNHPQQNGGPYMTSPNADPVMQSKSFKILQNAYDSQDNAELQKQREEMDFRSQQEMDTPHQGWMNHPEQRMKYSQDQCQIGPLVTVIRDDESSDKRPPVQTKFFKVLQAITDTDSEEDGSGGQQVLQEPKKYTGSNIPSRSFRMLQAMTDADGGPGPGQSDL